VRAWVTAAIRRGAALALVLLGAVPGSAWAADRAGAPGTGAGDETAPVGAPAETSPDWLARESLTGDWGGSRTWLKEHGVTLRPRLTQFYQGLAAGDGEHGYDYGGKADLRVAADLGKLGFWDGFSMTVQADYNFGESVNGRGGVLIPPNTALNSPGMHGADAFDVSSLYFGQTFGNGISVLFGKINMIELVAGKPFMGGAGVDSFWNHTFVATPTGTVPPYLFGVLGAVFTEKATYRLWVYDPNSYANTSILENAFADGVSIRGQIDLNVTIAGRRGHQGLTAFYSTKDGTDLSSLGDILLPTPDPETVATKDFRYYFAYSFDQYLYQSATSPEEGFGLFGQFGVSDGNPNGLYWSMYLGVGGKGLIPRRSRDNWGVGFYYDGLSDYVKDALASVLPIRDEQGLELFYNFALTQWLTVGADLQVIEPGLGCSTAVVPGLRCVIRL
jgi:porin